MIQVTQPFLPPKHEYDKLLEQIWEYSDGVFSRTIDTHIQRLRSKLKDAGPYIETVRGVGYRFQNSI